MTRKEKIGKRSDGINKKIKKEDLESYITDNWLRGRNCKIN